MPPAAHISGRTAYLRGNAAERKTWETSGLSPARPPPTYSATRDRDNCGRCPRAHRGVPPTASGDSRRSFAAAHRKCPVGRSGSNQRRSPPIRHAAAGQRDAGPCGAKIVFRDPSVCPYEPRGNLAKLRPRTSRCHEEGAGCLGRGRKCLTISRRSIGARGAKKPVRSPRP